MEKQQFCFQLLVNYPIYLLQIFDIRRRIYNEYLLNNNLIDRADKYKLCSGFTNKLDYIIIDGFSSYNNQQLELLTKIIDNSKTVITTHLPLREYNETREF